MSERKWCWSGNGERFEGSFATRNEAKAYAMSEHSGFGTFWLGRVDPLNAAECAKDVIDRWDVVQDIDLDLEDRCGAECDGVVDGADESALKAALSAVVEMWVAKHYGHFFGVDEIEMVVLGGEP